MAASGFDDKSAQAQASRSVSLVPSPRTQDSSFKLGRLGSLPIATGKAMMEGHQSLAPPCFIPAVEDDEPGPSLQASKDMIVQSALGAAAVPVSGTEKSALKRPRADSDALEILGSRKVQPRRTGNNSLPASVAHPTSREPMAPPSTRPNTKPVKTGPAIAALLPPPTTHSGKFSDWPWQNFKHPTNKANTKMPDTELPAGGEFMNTATANDAASSRPQNFSSVTSTVHMNLAPNAEGVMNTASAKHFTTSSQSPSAVITAVRANLLPYSNKHISPSAQLHSVTPTTARPIEPEQIIFPREWTKIDYDRLSTALGESFNHHAYAAMTNRTPMDVCQTVWAIAGIPLGEAGKDWQRRNGGSKPPSKAIQARLKKALAELHRVDAEDQFRIQVMIQRAAQDLVADGSVANGKFVFGPRAAMAEKIAMEACAAAGIKIPASSSLRPASWNITLDKNVAAAGGQNSTSSALSSPSGKRRPAMSVEDATAELEIASKELERAKKAEKAREARKAKKASEMER